MASEMHDTPLTGRAGRADRVEALDDEALVQWLIEAPGQTPAWDKYLLLVVRLRDGVPGLPPPKRQFEGATHELLVMALNPDTPITPARMAKPGWLDPLRPLNLIEQFEATDEEMRQLAWWGARAVVEGVLPAEPPLGYESYRLAWKTSMVKTLAHIRGEEHAP